MTVSEKEKDRIVNYYNKHREEKGIVDKIIIKFKISKSTLYNILDERDTELYRKTPVISEDNEYKDEEDEEDDITNNNKPIIGDTILAKIEEYWGDRDDIPLRNKDISYLIVKSWEIKYGVDGWKMWEDFILDTEKILSRNELEKALQDIKENRNPFETFESVLQDYREIYAREILKSLQQPSETPEPSEPRTPPREPFFNEQFIENFLAIKNPILYRLYKINKGETDPLMQYIKFLEQVKKIKDSKPNLKNINLRQKEVENIKPKERDADLNPQEIKKAIISSMPKPMPKRAHNKKKS